MRELPMDWGCCFFKVFWRFEPMQEKISKAIKSEYHNAYLDLFC